MNEEDDVKPSFKKFFHAFPDERESRDGEIQGVIGQLSRDERDELRSYLGSLFERHASDDQLFDIWSNTAGHTIDFRDPESLRTFLLRLRDSIDLDLYDTMAAALDDTDLGRPLAADLSRRKAVRSQLVRRFSEGESSGQIQEFLQWYANAAGMKPDAAAISQMFHRFLRIYQHSSTYQQFGPKHARDGSW